LLARARQRAVLPHHLVASAAASISKQAGGGAPRRVEA